jgi:hypothetical protein
MTNMHSAARPKTRISPPANPTSTAAGRPPHSPRSLTQPTNPEGYRKLRLGWPCCGGGLVHAACL